MNSALILITVLFYLAVMFFLSYLSSKEKNKLAFFGKGEKNKWYLVALAMISSGMSGITFVSVPGMVQTNGFSYLQMCLGFFAAYIVIAFVLVPVFYKLDLISIYEYIDKRLGKNSYKTGAWFFFISKLLGVSVRLFLLCQILQTIVFQHFNIPFYLNVLSSLLIIVLYTHKGGVKSVIWIDILKTICMISSIVISIIFIAQNLNLDLKGILSSVKDSPMSQIFFFEDFRQPQYFWKQFLGGFFIVIAMTGLDQDMMQRILTCKNQKESQKNLIVSSICQTLVIAMFLCLGVLLYQFAAKNNILAAGDKLFPAIATSGMLPLAVGLFFIIGFTSSSYSSGGSALTSLTTSFTIDILGINKEKLNQLSNVRQIVHILIAILISSIILVFYFLNNNNAIETVFKLASYTYGPILGFFSFGILTKRQIKDKFTPYIAILSPLICLLLQLNAEKWFGGYRFSYEILVINAAMVFIALMLFSKKAKN